jgi:threonine dehydrogenase-like Zn-dependent dehydrogenase
MLGAVIEAPRRIRMEQVADPQPGPGQVRIALEGCGVCASNLATWEGRPWFTYPNALGAPGHEGWGRVQALGAGVSDLSVGDRVAMLSYKAYAECDLAQADQVLKLPAELDGQPFPGEALACAMNIFERAQISAEHTVAIVGVGFLGVLLTKLAAEAGAKVIGISRRSSSLQAALAFGAANVCQLDDASRVQREVMRLTEQRGCERVIEAVGAQETLDLAASLTAERGRLVIAGYHQDSPRSVDMQMWNWRGLDVINAHERDPQVYMRGMRAALEWVRRGGLDLRSVCTHAFPLAALDRALDAVGGGTPGLLKAWVAM